MGLEKRQICLSVSIAGAEAAVSKTGSYIVYGQSRV
jgi:hypothetical protein